ncbi:MAG: trypsin-like peptidase domain-containing protein [Candidatus Bathyarchaeota archaeon]|nr:trypsin-like peptidase domain-containing protein [Candidatus Bathyarchaeota archaeon]MDW8040916.1 trypsin-like peptidase domain-containing protein [Nitrososphaerota archaeon]
MGWEHTLTIDKKFIVALILVAVALGCGFSAVYWDLKTTLNTLQDKYASVSTQLETLEGLIEQLHYIQKLNLTAVQIYNKTRNSVVLVIAGSKSGSGFVYRVEANGKGYLITNYHVVEGSESNVKVTFFIDGKPIQVAATVRGKDIYSDLAVLEVHGLPAEAKPLSVGDSTRLFVGEPVYAIGNPFGLEGSMTSGIVSQLGRVLRLSDLGVPEPWGKYSIVDIIQFDAAVNPGNSGGPLLNSIGQVVGVTFAIETTEEVKAFIGIGYAIPSIIMKRVADSIIARGKYEHPWMGIAYNASHIGGLLIVDVDSTGPSFGKLKPGDVIVAVDNRTINRAEDMIIYLERYKSPGDTVSLKVMRDNKLELVAVTLGKRPE